MTKHSFTIPKPSDKLIFEVFSDVKKQYAFEHFTVSLLGHYAAYDCNTKDLSVVEDALTRNGFLISHVNLSTPGYTVELKRNQPGASLADAAIFDVFEITAEAKSKITPDKQTELADRLVKQFKAFDLSKTILAPQLKAQGRLEAMHNQTLESLERFAVDLNQQLLETRNKLEKEYFTRKKELDVDFQKRRTELEFENQSNRERLETRKSELELLQKGLDDRNNTHARRKKQEELRDAILKRSTKFVITPETQALRRPIHYACMIGLSMLALANVYFFVIITSEVSFVLEKGWAPFALTLIKQFGLTLAFLGLLAYYIRWMNRWFDKHATAEFLLKQFELDMDRASWAVETGLEWKSTSEGKTELPTELLQAITRNLFSSDDGKHSEEMHPADYLASALLGTAKGIKLSVAGNELELDSRKLRKDLSTK